MIRASLESLQATEPGPGIRSGISSSAGKTPLPAIADTSWALWGLGRWYIKYRIRTSPWPLGAAASEGHMRTDHHGALAWQSEGVDRASRVAGHRDEELLAPASHGRSVGRRDRDSGEEVGSVLEV